MKAIAIGNFDGVHRGHRTLLEKLKRKACELGCQAAVLTFVPHPQTILRPDRPLQLLTTYEERAELLKQAGVDEVVEQSFHRDFSNLTAREFFTEILLKRLDARALIVGYDFAFGKNREGDLSLLKTLALPAGVEICVENAQRDQEEIISSTVIRGLIAKGDLGRASHLLGYDFSFRGRVEHGQKLGRKIGFPTVNLSLHDQGSKIIPPFGVYATLVRVGEDYFPAVSNLGLRPTVVEGATHPVLETYLLDTQTDLYGKTIEVAFKKFLRPELKFGSLEELSSQITKDVGIAREFFDT